MNPPPQSTRVAYIPTLDGWRAVAIIGVMLSHAQNTFRAIGWTSPAFLGFTSWLRLGVDLFFAISGFLICNRLLREIDLHQKISLSGFYTRRIFRILPLYFCYLLILSLLSIFAGVPSSAASVRSCLFFYRNYVDPPDGVYTNHFWSLSVEEHFYLLWPLFLGFCGRRRALWMTPMLALLVHVWRSVNAHKLVLVYLPNILARTDTRLDALLWGCFAAMLCFDRSLRFPAWTTPAVLGVLTASAVLAVPALPLVWAIGFPLLLVTTIGNADGLVGRFLELPLLRWIGRLSYSLYIWQTLFLQTGSTPDPAWLTFLKHWPLNLVCIFAIATLSHYLLEQPMIRLGHRLSTARSNSHLRPQPATASS